VRRGAQAGGVPTRDGAETAAWVRWRERARQGAGVLAYHLVRRTRARCGLSRWFDLQVRECVAVPTWRLRLPARAARGVEVGDLGPAHLAQLERLRAAVGVAYAERFAAAHRCIGAWLDGRLVAFVWLQLGPARLPSMLGCSWLLPAAVAWVYDIYSDPQVLGAAPLLYLHLRQHRPGPGVRVLMGQTELDNQRSRLAHRSLGYEVTGLLCSLRLGRWSCHLSRGMGQPGWRLHRGQSVIPLHAMTARLAGAEPAPAAGGLRLQCSCGREVEAGDDRLTCACGRSLGARCHGMTVLGAGVEPAGELRAAEMERLLQRAEQVGWRTAAAERLPAALLDYAVSPRRAAFHELLPLVSGARVLEVGANWGGVAAPLAGRYRVVALEDVAQRARFLALRKRQEGLEHLDVVLGELSAARFGAGQFDAVIANGVLEWAATLETWGRPRDIQLSLLCRWRELLAPGGCLYLASENRFGRERWRADRAPGGRRPPGVMWRALGRIGSGLRPQWSEADPARRIRTYTYAGYRRLFADAGLEIAAVWISPSGYNCPDRLLSLQRRALQYARPTSGAAESWVRRAGERPWVWRWLGSDFVFLLTPTRGAGRAAAPRQPATGAAGARYA
jgi:SAM-dependent methyltransferase